MNSEKEYWPENIISSIFFPKSKSLKSNSDSFLLTFQSRVIFIMPETMWPLPFQSNFAILIASIFQALKFQIWPTYGKKISITKKQVMHVTNHNIRGRVWGCTNVLTKHLGGLGSAASLLQGTMKHSSNKFLNLDLTEAKILHF